MKCYYFSLFVKDDSTRISDKDYDETESYATTEGIITDITKLSRENYQVVLKSDDEQIEFICDKNMIDDQNLEEGQQVAIDFYDDGNQLNALAIIILDQKDTEKKEDEQEKKDSGKENDSKSKDENQQDDDE